MSKLIITSSMIDNYFEYADRSLVNLKDYVKQHYYPDVEEIQSFIMEGCYRNYDFRDQSFQHIDISNAVFTECNFKNLDLSNKNLDNTGFFACNLSEANFSGSSFAHTMIYDNGLVTEDNKSFYPNLLHIKLSYTKKEIESLVEKALKEVSDYDEKIEQKLKETSEKLSKEYSKLTLLEKFALSLGFSSGELKYDELMREYQDFKSLKQIGFRLEEITTGVSPNLEKILESDAVYQDEALSGAVID